MPKYRLAVLPALLTLALFLAAANLIFLASARGQTPRPPKVATYMLQVRSGLRNDATFTTAPGYKVVSVLACTGGTTYGQGSDLCLIERRGDDQH